MGRWETDQTFSDVKVNRIESADVTDGEWYVIIRGDYTGRVSGNVYDLTNRTDPAPIELTPTWEKCKLPESATSSTSARVRVSMSSSHSACLMLLHPPLVREASSSVGTCKGSVCIMYLVQVTRQVSKNQVLT